MSKTLYQRQDNVIVKVTVETFPAVIEWQDIVDAIEVVPDDWPEKPWQNCDGYDHDLRLLPINDKNQRNGHAAFVHNGLWVTVEMDYDQDLYDWYRNRGASKQAADQLTRQSLRKRIELIISWYRNGWEWWFVRGEMHGCHASVGGIDDYDYAKQCCSEIAHELAGELTALGYEIKGEAEPQKQIHHRNNVNLFNM